MARFLASHALMLAVQGIPAIYVHSLLASVNDVAGVTATGQARSINRMKFSSLSELRERLSNREDRAAQAMTGLRDLMMLRRSSPAFHPNSSQKVLDTSRTVIGVERRAEDGAAARVYVNVSSNPEDVRDMAADIVQGHRVDGHGDSIRIGPWGSAWVIE
jgi:sucrose phosphorylase